MASSTIRFTSFPRTESPTPDVAHVMEVFRNQEDQIGTTSNPARCYR